jgi:cell filamentation protein
VTPGDYDAFDDPYTYRGTECLRNRLGIREQDTLQAFELEMSSIRAEEPLPPGRFGATNNRRIHKHQLQDF